MDTIECPCGFSFPEAAGKHGCPNCHGDAMTGPLGDAERQAISRKARAEAGGKQIAVMLTPKAAEKLAGHVAKGETIAQVVNRLLVKSRL